MASKKKKAPSSAFKKVLEKNLVKVNDLAKRYGLKHFGGTPTKGGKETKAQIKRHNELLERHGNKVISR